MKSFAPDLLKWYAKHKRDLPWRHTKDPYAIWVSEMMLQQTTVATVIEYYKRWLKQFPSVKHLAKASENAVLKAWQGLGYYNRARNLHKAAQEVVKAHQGYLPQDPLVVRALPGFGPYATAAVLSIAYKKPLPVVDANVRRVMMRVLGIEGLSDTKQDGGITAYLEKIIPAKMPGDFNQAMMELGALICKPKAPLCNQCPLLKYCLAFKEGRQEEIPIIKKKDIQHIHAVVAVIKKADAVYLQKREDKGLLAGMWELPGGKIEKGEDALDALHREIKEELGVQIKEARYLFSVNQFYTVYKVNLKVFECVLKGRAPEDSTHRWIKLNDLAKYPMPSGTVKIFNKL